METAEEIAGFEVFAMLDADQKERLARRAADVRLVLGEFAANEGEDRALFAVLEGRIEVVQHVDGIETIAESLAPDTTSAAAAKL